MLCAALSVQCSPAAARRGHRTHWVPIYGCEARKLRIGLHTAEQLRFSRHSKASLARANAWQSSPFANDERCAQDITHLRSIYLKNFASVPEEIVCFAPGLNCLTGASGAGKSVILNALGVALGAVAGTEMVRAPEQHAVVEATFQLSNGAANLFSQLLDRLGMPSSVLPSARRAQLTIRREIHITETIDGSRGMSGDSASSGTMSAGEGSTFRSRCYVNGAATPLRTLRKLGSALVDVNGQHASLSLRSPATQLALLDALAGTSHAASCFASTLARLRAIQLKIQEASELEDPQGRAEDEALLSRVDDMHLVAGEDSELVATLERVTGHAQSIEECAMLHGVIGSRSEDGTVLAQLAAAARKLRSIAQRESSLESRPGGAVAGGAGSDGSVPHHLKLAERDFIKAEAAMEAVQGHIDDFVEALEFDQAEYDAARARLDAVRRLLADCGARSVEELLEVAEDTRAALDRWELVAKKLPQWRMEEIRLLALLEADAVALSRARRAAAARLRHAVESCLSQLAMEQSRFDVRIGWDAVPNGGGQSTTLRVGDAATSVGELPGETYTVSPNGLDRVELLLAAGPAEPLHQLRAVASGGENARVMLALKAAPRMAAAGASDELRPVQIARADLRATLETAAQPRANGNDSRPGFLMIEDACGHSGIFPLSGCTLGSDGRDADSSLVFDGCTNDWDGELAALGTPVVVLDEIDAGVGTRLGLRMARMLHSMARGGQILAVSHVPQVAAYADHHIMVQKELQGGRTVSRFTVLHDAIGRTSEVAAMFGLERSVAERLMAQARAEVHSDRALTTAESELPPGTRLSDDGSAASEEEE